MTKEEINKLLKSTETSRIERTISTSDMDKFQDGINSLSKAVGLFSDLFANRGTNTNSNTYKPRAVYKRFED